MELHELLGCRESPQSLNAGRLARVHEESTSSIPVQEQELVVAETTNAVQPSGEGTLRVARNEEVGDLSAGSRTLAAEVSKIKLPAWYPLAHSRMQSDARHRRLCLRQLPEPAGNGVGEGHEPDASNGVRFSDAATGSSCASSAGKLGHVFLTLGREGGQHASRLFKKELASAQQAQDRRREALAFEALGQAYSATEKHQKAAGMYELGLEIARQIGDRALEASTCWHLATSYKAQGQSQLAEGLLLQRNSLLSEGERSEDDAGDGGSASMGCGDQDPAPPRDRALSLQALQVSGGAQLGNWMTAVFEHRFQEKQALKRERQLAIARIRHESCP